LGHTPSFRTGEPSVSVQGKFSWSAVGTFLRLFDSLHRRCTYHLSPPASSRFHFFLFAGKRDSSDFLGPPGTFQAQAGVTALIPNLLPFELRSFPLHTQDLTLVFLIDHWDRSALRLRYWFQPFWARCCFEPVFPRQVRNLSAFFSPSLTRSQAVIGEGPLSPLNRNALDLSPSLSGYGSCFRSLSGLFFPWSWFFFAPGTWTVTFFLTPFFLERSGWSLPSFWWWTCQSWH